MGFNTYGTGNTNSGAKESTVDFAAYNKYIVETAALESPEVLIGVVSGIIDLGIQEQEDAEIVFTGSPEDEADIIDDKPDTYFKTGFDPQTKKEVRFKCYPQKAIQSVGVAVDFPEIMLDKGQFFGDTSGVKKPLRMFLGGTFFNQSKKAMQIARPTPLRIGKDTQGRWSFNNKHLFYKMAVAAKIIQPDGVFLPQDIDKLVGQAFQFEANIFMKQGKDGKEYMTEKVAFKSGLGRGQVAPTDDVETFVIQFSEPNDEAKLKELRAHVVNTIKAAKNYEGSPIQKQLEAVKPTKVQSSVPVEDKPAEAPASKAVSTRKARTPAPVIEDELEDAPF